MAFPSDPRPLTPLSYRDDELHYLQQPFPAGQDPWQLYNEQGNTLQSVDMAFATQDWYQSLQAVAEPVRQSVLQPTPQPTVATLQHGSAGMPVAINVGPYDGTALLYSNQSQKSDAAELSAQSWDAGQYRPQQLSETDLAPPAGLSVFTTGDSVSPIDDVPILTATDTSVTTTGTSPEEFRSPLRTATRDDTPSLPRQNGRNFPSSSIAPLQEWFTQNLNDPYPSKETKDMLAAQSGLEPRQVNNWFINARKRQLPRQSATNLILDAISLSPENLCLQSFAPEPATSLAQYPPFGTELGPLVEDQTSTGNVWSTTTPNGLLSTSSIFKRHSQPTIFQDPGSAGSMPPLSTADFCLPLSASDDTSPSGTIIPRTPSSSSFTSQAEGPSVGISSRRGLRRHYRGPRPLSRRSPITPAGPTSSNPRSPNHEQSDSSSEHDHEPQSHGKSGEIFQCTFPNCGKTFSSKTWKRHEETKHLPRFQWTCMATGWLVNVPNTSPSTTPNPAYDPFSLASTPAMYSTQTMCAFCHELNPDPHAHPQECEHRLADCLCRPGAERTFSRKDHLVQHLRNFHRFTPADTGFCASWRSKVEYANRTWGCGFCGDRLTSWEKRARHLRAHFREGWRVETSWDERKVKGSGFGFGGFLR